MAILKGFDSFIGFRELSTTGSINTVPAEFLFADSFVFNKTVEEVIVPEISVGSRTHKRRVRTGVEATGSVEKKLDPNNGIGLYQYLQAGSLTSASQGSGTFTHTFSEGDDVPSSTRLQFQTSFGGSSATTLNWFNGVVESYSLEATAGGLAQETWNFRFSDHSAAVNTLAAVALTQTPPITARRVSVRLGTSITTASEVAMKSITLNVNNNLIQNRELSTNTVSDLLYEIKEINGTFEATFENLSLYEDFLNNTASAMQIHMESEDITDSVTHYVRFNIPKVFFNGTTPSVDGVGEIVQSVEFSAIFGSNAGYQLQIEVVNSNSVVPK